MGLFSKKKGFDFYKQLSDSDNENIDDSFLISFADEDESSYYLQNTMKNTDKKPSTYALTAQEVISETPPVKAGDIPMTNSGAPASPLDALRERVLNQAKAKTESEQKKAPAGRQNTAVAPEKTAFPQGSGKPLPDSGFKLNSADSVINGIETGAESGTAVHTPVAVKYTEIPVAPEKPAVKSDAVAHNTPAPQKGARTSDIPEASSAMITEDFKIADFHTGNAAHTSVEPESIQTVTSIPEENAEEVAAHTNLLEKCTPFILDDGGNSPEEKPSYTLESVESILNSAENDVIDKLSQKYNVSLEDNTKPGQDIKPERSKAAENPPTVIPEKPVSKPVIQSETIVMERSKLEKKLPVLSDLDATVSELSTDNSDDNTTAGMFTKRFDPIPGSTGRNTMTFTRIPDLKSGITGTDDDGQDEKRLIDIFGEDEPDSFEPEDEYLCHADARRIGKKLMLKKRSAFFRLIVSCICLLASGVFAIPAVNIMFSTMPVVPAVVQCCLAGTAMLANLDMLRGLKTLFTRNIAPECAVILTCITGAAAVALSFSELTRTCRICLLLCFILCMRTVYLFKQCSYILNNFRIIANKNKKNAVTLIEDRPTTFAMAHNAIDGDVLAAASRRSTNITDYMHNATAPAAFEGRFGIVFLVFFIAAVLCGIAGLMTVNLAAGVYSAFCAMALLSAPTLFSCDILPLSSAAKRLNRRGAMIAGKQACNKLEMANACVLNSADFFPRGCITLHNMQVLSDNSIDETLLAATAVAIAIKSPLSDIFRDIAATGEAKNLPAADSVKYENQLGITGWVGNRRLFIGNRTLLEAHGIHMPDIEVDKKILRQGYFPVYVGCNQKACALLIIKYNVSLKIAKELNSLCNCGVTVLVNNCDSNISAPMLCDYFGLYPDTVHIMSDSGIHMYKSRVNYVESTTAPAVYGNYPAVLPLILTTAIRTKKSVAVLRCLHIIMAALGVLLFMFLSFNGTVAAVSALYLFLYEAAVTLISRIIYLFIKP